MKEDKRIKIIRRLLAFFIVALFVSGITVWPASAELRFALQVVGPDSVAGAWLLRLQAAYEPVAANSSFLLYGYDWLVFAHIVLAALFIGPWLQPVRNKWVLQFGIGACVAIFPLAFICGSLRGIPFWWQLVDCSFGVIGAAILWPCLRLVVAIENDITNNNKESI